MVIFHGSTWFNNGLTDESWCGALWPDQVALQQLRSEKISPPLHGCDMAASLD